MQITLSACMKLVKHALTCHYMSKIKKSSDFKWNSAICLTPRFVLIQMLLNINVVKLIDCDFSQVLGESSVPTSPSFLSISTILNTDALTAWSVCCFGRGLKSSPEESQPSSTLTFSEVRQTICATVSQGVPRQPLLLVQGLP